MKKIISSLVCFVMFFSIVSVANIGISAKTTVDVPKMKYANAASNTTVVLSWSKVKSASGYVVYRKAGSSKYKKITTIKSNKTKFKDTKLKKGKKYSYYVKAYKKNKVSTKYSKKSKSISVVAKYEKISYYKYLKKQIKNKKYSLAKTGKTKLYFNNSTKTTGLKSSNMGLVSACEKDLDGDGLKDLVLVSFVNNKNYGVNYGKFMISVISKVKGKYKVSKYTINSQLTLGTNASDAEVFIQDGRIGMYQIHGLMQGTSSSGYGFTLYELKYTGEKIKLANQYRYHWQRSQNYIYDMKNDKVYCNYGDGKFNSAIKKLKKHMNGVFDEYFTVGGVDEMKYVYTGKHPKGRVDLTVTEYVFGDYDTYYYFKVVDKTKLASKVK